MSAPLSWRAPPRAIAKLFWRALVWRALVWRALGFKSANQQPASAASNAHPSRTRRSTGK